MAVLEWPEDVCPASLTWRPESNTKTFRSPFNGSSQTARFPGTRWVCSLTFNNLTDEKSRRIDALVASLDGEYGRVKVRDWGRSGRAPAGVPVVDGANQTGTQLQSKGWTPGVVVLRQGDYFTVNDELKMVTADVTSVDNQEMHVSHETIYKTLFIQTRGALKKELQQCLRSGRAVRRSRTSSLKGKGLGSIPNTIPISERPPEAADRAIPGHWEGDLIQGSKNSYIITLVERHSRFVMLAKIRDNKTITVISALIRQARELPAELYKTLTWDRGAEMTSHTRFTVATDIQIYFCDPQSPWQRGSNENTNRLLRQYFPKGTDLSVHSQQRLNSVARQLNERPRKTLDYESPAERFNKCVASIS